MLFSQMETTGTEEWRKIESRPGYEISSFGRVRSLDRIITRKDSGKRKYRGRLIKAVVSDGYYRVYLGAGKKDRVHKIVAEVFLGLGPESTVDHMDRNKLNNFPSNLRKASGFQNNSNVGKLKNNTSGFKGVSWDKDACRWAAQVQYLEKNIKIGRFKDREEAARAYDKKAVELFGEFACVNFPIT